MVNHENNTRVEIQVFWLSKHVLISFCMFWTILYKQFLKKGIFSQKFMKQID